MDIKVEQELGSKVGKKMDRKMNIRQIYVVEVQIDS